MAIYFLVIITHWIKILRFLGLGVQYIKFSFLPLIFFMLNFPVHNFILIFLLAVCIIFHFRIFFLFLKITGFSQTGSFIEDKLIRYIKTNKIIISDLQHIMQIKLDITKKVYWGTHAEVFNERLNNFFLF